MSTAALKREADRALRSDSRRALAIAERAQAAARASREAVAGAVAEHALAKARHALSRYAEAEAGYLRARSLYRKEGLAAGAAAAALGRVGALFHLGRFTEAEREALAARREFLALGDPTGAAKVWVNLANVRHAQDRHPEAIGLLEKARPVLARAGLREAVAAVDLNRANSESLLGRFAISAGLYRQARAAYVALGRAEMVGRCDYNRAYDLFLGGDVHGARRLLDEVRDGFRRLGVRHPLALAARDQAEISLWVGLPDAALRAAVEARHEFLLDGATVEAARAALVEAMARRALGDETRARRLAEEARGSFGASRHRIGMSLADLCLAGSPLLPAARRSHLALASARTLSARGLGGRAAAALVLAGTIESERGRLASSRRLLARGLRLARAAGNGDARLRAEHARGRTEEARGNAARALVHHRRAVESYEQMRSGLRSEEDRLAFAADRSVVLEDALASALDAGRLDQAFAMVERARARALVDLLAIAPALRGRAGGRAARAAAELRDAKRRLSPIEAQARDRERRALPVPSTLGRELRRYAAAHQAALLDLARASPESSYALAGRPVITLEEARSGLGPGRALLVYFLERGCLGGMVIGERDARTFRALTSLTRLEGLLDDARFALGAPRMGHARRHRAALVDDARAALGALGAALLAPLEGAIGDRAAIVVAPALLHGFPFPALAIERREVSLVPSATVLGQVRARLQRGRGALVVSRADARAPAIGREAAEVTRLLRARRLDGVRATAAGLARHAAGRRIIHIAAHGVYQADDPLLSGVDLADGRMALPEVAALRLDAELVTLSACESALGEPRGDEVLGLCRSFLLAGARALVASLWTAPDDPSAHLMIEMYRGIAQGLPVSAALRAAALDCRRAHPHPFDWAGFVAYGATDSPVLAVQDTIDGIGSDSRGGQA